MTIKFYSTENFKNQSRVFVNSHLDAKVDYPNLEAYNIAQDISIEKSLPQGINNPLSLMERFGVQKSMSFKETYELIAQKLNQSIF